MTMVQSTRSIKPSGSNMAITIWNNPSPKTSPFTTHAANARNAGYGAIPHFVMNSGVRPGVPPVVLPGVGQPAKNFSDFVRTIAIKH